MSRVFRTTLLVFLVLVVLGPVTAEVNAAPPDSESWGDALAATVTAWIDQLRSSVTEITAAQEVHDDGNSFPNLDPNGLSGTTDQDPGAGNTFPNQDPDG